VLEEGVRALVKNVGAQAYVDAHRVTSADGLFDGVPFDLLPAANIFRIEPAGDVKVAAKDGDLNLALQGQLGRGRWSSCRGCPRWLLPVP